jgi:membrane-associated phospholipid phosphatase
MVPLRMFLQSKVWNAVEPFDKWLIVHINQSWQNPILDTVLSLSRETLFWMPLYIFLFFFIQINFRSTAWYWILGVVLAAVASDLISSHVVKELIFRVRPCQDEEIAHQLRFFINYCPKSSGFTSSHATSHFAQAMFFFLTLRHLGKWWLWPFAWAALICYAQVYVGVHYPTDVVGGALLGMLIGWLIAKIIGPRFNPGSGK